MNEIKYIKKVVVCLLNDKGDIIVSEREVVEVIELLWGSLFSMSGEAEYGVENECIDTGMKYGGITVLGTWS